MHHECGMGRLSWVVILLFSLAKIRKSFIQSKLSSHFFLRSSGNQTRNPPNSPPTKPKIASNHNGSKRLQLMPSMASGQESGPHSSKIVTPPTSIYPLPPAAHTAHPSFPKSRCHFLLNVPYAIVPLVYSVP